MKSWNSLCQMAGLMATTVITPAFCFQPAPDPVPFAISKPGGSYLGVAVIELSSERAKELNLREEQGVEVTRVAEESPAEKAGLKKGDVVLTWNGQRVEGLEQFMRLVRETPAGREVKLSVSRNGSSQQLAVKTESRKVWATSKLGEPGEISRIEIPEIRLPELPRAVMSWRTTILGFEAEALDAQLAQFFGVREGVLVRSVAKGSAAEKSGLKAGDVIVRVDETKVSTPREVTAAVRASKSRKSVPVTAVREKREMSFTVGVEDSGSEFNYSLPKRLAIPKKLY